jgi:branched-chain amino acid transport system ATP-binding protein
LNLTTELLAIDSLTRRFGGLIAVDDVSFTVNENEILSVIGPNGAGKSTLFKLIASFLRPTRGEVRFRGDRISGLAPHMVARKGVVRTFQETTIFKAMSVPDNVIVAHHLRSRASLAGFYFGSLTARQDEKEFGRSADEILAFLGLTPLSGELASNLPHGHLRALGGAIGLAPVIDGVAAAVKLCESAVTLGLRTSKRGGYASPRPKRFAGLFTPFSPTARLGSPASRESQAG